MKVLSVVWCRGDRQLLGVGIAKDVETYGGKRFQSGEWPAEDPPIYPGT